MTSPNLFDEVRDLPDEEAARQFSRLIGLDHLKTVLVKQARLLLTPGLLEDWSRQHHNVVLPCVDDFSRRPPLIVFSGDVGTGKTTLADSFGDPVARSEKLTRVTLLRLSLMTRGRGAVGEMTHLISQAFDEVVELARKGSNPSGKPSSAVIFVIDEADALAESRATEQMHHEDRAGVNVLIRGIDRLARDRLPGLVVLCTNRVESLDPAVMRRAAVHHEFRRPTDEQRESLLRDAFGNTFDDTQYRELALLTGPDRNGRDYGYTFSDIAQRFVPNLLLEAFPDRPVTFELARSVLDQLEPTIPFVSTEGRAKP